MIEDLLENGIFREEKCVEIKHNIVINFNSVLILIIKV
jgi:hypothetical protein